MGRCPRKESRHGGRREEIEGRGRRQNKLSSALYEEKRESWVNKIMMKENKARFKDAQPV